MTPPITAPSSPRTWFARHARAALCVVLAGCASEAATTGASCIAPANPGGGWDLTCRATAEALGTTAPGAHALHVQNIPGEGGGVAFAKVAAGKEGSERLIVAASPSTLLGLAQRHYGQFTERDVRWIAAVGAEPSVIAVRPDAPWRTLGDFVAAWRARPEAITVGGASAVGGQDHMKILLLARAAGIDVRRVRYVPLSGPLEAITSLSTGTIQVFPGDLSEVHQQVETKQLRALAVLDEKRASGAFEKVPTAREQGLDVSWVVWRGFYAPRGTTDAAYEQWVERLRVMAASPEWNALLARNGLSPFFLGGKEFQEFVTGQIAAYRTVSKEIGIVQ
jgi:putative tricarboxylic transport membrane protein